MKRCIFYLYEINKEFDVFEKKIAQQAAPTELDENEINRVSGGLPGDDTGLTVCRQGPLGPFGVDDDF